MTVPESWRVPEPAAGSLADLPWWELFHDPALRDLIRVALEESKDLRLAVARVAEARAQLGFVRADRFPQVDARGQAETRRTSEVGAMRLLPGTDPEQGFFRTSLDGAFELDLWGRLTSATDAARAELLATEEARRTVVITLVSDVAQAYFDLSDLDLELAITRRTLESRREALRIVRPREQEGLTSELDVRRAEGELAAAAALVPDLERRSAQTEHRLSVLLGRNPEPVVRGRGLTEQPLPPTIPAGLPSALLERRPDLRQAEQRLLAANAASARPEPPSSRRSP